MVGRGTVNGTDKEKERESKQRGKGMKEIKKQKNGREIMVLTLWVQFTISMPLYVLQPFSHAAYLLALCVAVRRCALVH